MQNITKKINDVVELDSESFEHIMNSHPTVIILDVRTIIEFNQGRIANSILIDFYGSDFPQQIEKLDRANKYLVYCRSGNRSFFAATMMLELGFEDVSHLAPGIIGWDGKIEC